jgi:hypothetical protein
MTAFVRGAAFFGDGTALLGESDRGSRDFTTSAGSLAGEAFLGAAFGDLATARLAATGDASSALDFVEVLLPRTDFAGEASEADAFRCTGPPKDFLLPAALWVATGDLDELSRTFCAICTPKR